MTNRTKTDETIKEYTSRVITLARRIDHPHDSPEFPEALLEQLLLEKATISKATWRKKKASLVYYFEQQSRLDLKEKLEAITVEGALTKTSSTSARKKKSLTETEENTVRAELERLASVPSTWGRQLLAFTESILITGMRPIEFNGARLFDTETAFITAGGILENYKGDWPMLEVHNGKQTNGRSFGEKRHLDLSALNQKQYLYIKIALSYAQSSATPSGEVSNYSDYYNSLRLAFYRIINGLFSGRSSKISLYTYRHQCIADMKIDNDYSLAQIAAIVGHGNDLTATEHYGLRRHGRARGEKVKANAVDVAKVRPLLESKMQKRKSLAYKPGQ